MLRKLKPITCAVSALVLIFSCAKDNSGPTAPAYTAPSITAQPQSRTVELGASVTFSVTATGNPAPAYQWKKDGVPISGDTAETCVVNAVGIGDTGEYTVTITNSQGSVTSNPAKLSVHLVAPAITTQPQGQTSADPGTSATFSVTATGIPAPAYQWKKDGVSISGATGASYTIASVGLADVGTYTVVVTNAKGSVTSSPAVLSVNQLFAAPVIVTQPPPAQTVDFGGTATFTVIATGSPAPAYQWKKDGIDIPGATSASLAISAVGTSDNGTYTVVITNSQGSVTSSGAVLTVHVIAPAITVQPAAQTMVELGGSATLTVTATGIPAPTYQWRKDQTAIAGATGQSYSISSAGVSDAGTYTVVVSNVQGSVTSDPAALTVHLVAPAITAQPAAQTTVEVGSSVTFSVTATGLPAPTYQWRKDQTPIAGATSANLIFVNAGFSDSGVYTVVVTNAAGSVTSNEARLSVVSKMAAPVITAQPQSQTVALGDSVRLIVAATGTPVPTYQWKKNNVAITGQTGPALFIYPAQLSDAGNYSVDVTNAKGSVASSQAALTVTTLVTGTWRGAITVDTMGMKVPVKLTMIYNADQTLLDTINASVSIGALTMKQVYVRTGTWRAISTSMLERTYVKCTNNARAQTCDPLVDTMAVQITGGNQWLVSLYGYSATLTKQ